MPTTRFTQSIERVRREKQRKRETQREAIEMENVEVTWSREEEKAFENAIAMHCVEEEITEDQWRRMASMVPTKSSEQKRDRRRRGSSSNFSGEQRLLFLLGLDKFGKGDWRSISRNFVISRTPTQVASHAQKYFIRLNSMNRDRRRSSIHDITTVNNQAPAVTGGGGGQQQQQQQVVKHRPALQQPQTQPQPQPQPHHPGSTMAGLGMYGGAPVGQPIIAPPDHMGSAVGTPVMLPPPMGGHHHHHHLHHQHLGVAPYPVPAYPVPQIPQHHPAPSTMH
ncbi:unnamed protein product [Thlaspi arvense]|uniref:Uncharacterized protein n=1 Tax=Thlaspi arvense TaxID=13288 RepID=A0AAU9RD86_THLAR|nr:unnamed protein product [Thlaspi arvense]